MKKDSEEYKEFIKIYKRANNNAVFFLENYYNIVHPDKKIELTDEEKQELYDEFKGIPYFDDMSKVGPYQKRIDELKAQGYKDWEIH